MHLGSWRLNPLEGNRPLTYLELADELADYVTDMGFTHVELLPVMEHPYAPSWGYQVTGLLRADLAVRHAGRLPRLRRPAARARDRRDPRLGARRTSRATTGRSPASTARRSTSTTTRAAASHPDWGTLVFNFGRNEVRNFLLASALYWLREYHADGLRVDAVASMLYLDYSRKAGEWVPNEYGGNEDLDAIAFLQAAERGRARARAGRR